ncbi:MAG: hypothetical protein R3F07_17160 [Opitutaceae bacterium]
MRSKLLSSALLILVSVPSLLVAQTDRSNLQIFLSARFAGQATATINNVGTIPSGNDLGETTTVMDRYYSDGYVLTDQRLTDDGDKIPDDGRTNRWGYRTAEQSVDGGSAVIFNDYSTYGEGQTAEGPSEGSVGMDMEFALRLGDYGVGGFGKAGPVNWGISFGLGLNDVNIRLSESITATLNATSDVYSLLGATLPEAPFQSPSSQTITITNADGSVSVVQVDGTVLLENRPLSRSTSSIPEGANIDGYWEVDGTYFTLRLGPWIRWRPFDRLSFRASAGVSGTVLGATLSYEEQGTISDSRTVTAKVDGDRETYTGIGYYGYLDAEFWITDVTSFFVGVTYENSSTELQLSAGGRTADVRFDTNVGFRLGISSHF